MIAKRAVGRTKASSRGFGPEKRPTKRATGSTGRRRGRRARRPPAEGGAGHGLAEEEGAEADRGGEEPEGPDGDAPVGARGGALRGLELGLVEGADDGALADDALALGYGADDGLDRGLGRGELALALVPVEEGVLYREAHHEARGEGGKGPSEPAVDGSASTASLRLLSVTRRSTGISVTRGLPSFRECSST